MFLPAKLAKYPIQAKESAIYFTIYHLFSLKGVRGVQECLMGMLLPLKGGLGRGFMNSL